MPIPARVTRWRFPPPLRAAAALLLGLSTAWAGWAAPVARAERWVRPVSGPAGTPFSVSSDRFAAGQHRGLDLRARPGSDVVAACAGRVAFAGSVPRAGRVVSVVCGRWRVTYLPLASVAVARGDHVRAGFLLGAVAPGHGGLHLGVRREGRRFGYVDPARFLGRTPPPPPRPTLVPRRGPGARPLPAPRPFTVPAPARPAGHPAPAPRAAHTGVVAAPPSAWVGLVVMLLAAGSGVPMVRRRRRRRCRRRIDGAGASAGRMAA